MICSSPPAYTRSGFVAAAIRTVLIFCGFVASALSEDICSTRACEEVARIYGQSLNLSRDPCSDFFSYVCDGWIRTMMGKYEFSSARVSTSTDDLLAEAVKTILLKKMRQAPLDATNGSHKVVRDSEMQPIMFFKSCTLSAKRPPGELNLATIRKFFHEIELPFFDEDATTGRNALSAILHLAIRFNINPILRVDFRKNGLLIRKTHTVLPSTLELNMEADQIEEQWKARILESFKNSSQDAAIIVEFGSFFEAFNVRVTRQNLLRLGRSYFTIRDAMRFVFLSTEAYTTYRLNTWSMGLGTTYFDFFNKHTGNLAKLQEEDRITMVPFFFEPLVIAMTDPELSPIFIDFVSVHLLRNEFLGHLGRTKCAHSAKCDPAIESEAEKFCATITQRVFQWSTAAMVARATHTDYTVRRARYLFNLFKCMYAKRIDGAGGMDMRTRVQIIEALVRVRARGLYPESLDRFEISELGFALSPYDMVHNIIEVRRSKRSLQLAAVGFPFHRNMNLDAPIGFIYYAATADVYLPASLLEFPYMVETLPLWSTLGAIGWAAAHEIGHAILKTVKNIATRARSPLERNESYYHTAYANSEECFKELYDAPFLNENQNERFYLEEAIADHLSLRVSLDALKWLKERNTFPRLPMKSIFNFEQMFFISRVYPQCWLSPFFSWSSAESHPPNFHRVNRGLSNFSPFATAFQCKSKDAMIAQTPCNAMF
ncbi:uncharacterized protein LOC108863996 [Galendromus occidentalis]|uniref:Uncharacterized protein LOC108863996 n=1 Tax=Galendromus occidentalis TaxID=34638 RepID=A0AAJ7L475_9ACAR|nr:uncharacterized protein LOC108863996 [Galendromus occidentalis]